MANFNVGATQNIGANANALAQPMIQASNNGLNAMNALQLARMNSQQGFSQIGNNLANSQLAMQQNAQNPFNFANIMGNLFTLGGATGSAISQQNAYNAMNQRMQQQNQLNTFADSVPDPPSQ